MIFNIIIKYYYYNNNNNKFKMGYGIKLLAKQSAYLPSVLENDARFADRAEYVKEEVKRIYEVNDKLFRLSGFAMEFIGGCKTLLRISEPDDEDDGADFWDNIYIWKNKYENMDWDELKPIVESLIETFSITFDGCDDEDKADCLDCIKILHSITDIATTFYIS